MNAEIEAAGQNPRFQDALSKVHSYAVPKPATMPTRAERSPHSVELYGESRAMVNVRQMIHKVAPTQASVLLIGESGTGKELVATAIHHASKCHDQAFVAINCGAFSANLIEAELFGYERGAFTGAVRSHRGCFERACGGTLFLDEITEMPLELQVKLLRALETGRFYRVGGEEEQTVNVRVIAATNRDPNQAVAQNLLREDLLYRLAVFPLPVPPLRAREGDVQLLAQRFLDELNAAAGSDKKFAASVHDLLRSHSWPGNVRELKNVVQRAYIMGDSEIDFGAMQPRKMDSMAAIDGNALQFTVGTSLADIERKVIVATLAHCSGHKRETAEILGLSLKTLYNRLNEYQSRARAAAPC